VREYMREDCRHASRAAGTLYIRVSIRSGPGAEVHEGAGGLGDPLGHKQHGGPELTFVVRDGDTPPLADGCQGGELELLPEGEQSVLQEVPDEHQVLGQERGGQNAVPNEGVAGGDVLDGEGGGVVPPAAPRGAAGGATHSRGAIGII